jgi:hypothetical protein
MAKKAFKKPNFKKTVGKNVEKQRAERSSFGYMNLPQGMKMFKESKGRINVDVIPYPVTNLKHMDRDSELEIAVPGSVWYKLPFKVHKNVGGGDGETVVCPTTFGLKCPICDHRKKRMSEGADKDELKSLQPSKRNLYAVIPIDVKDLFNFATK